MIEKSNFLNVQEAACFLKTTPAYLYKMVWKRAIPYYKPNGGRLLFSAEELRRFVEASRRSSASELEEKATTLLNARGR
jgi:excisionase family DNA binding protein